MSQINTTQTTMNTQATTKNTMKFSKQNRSGQSAKIQNNNSESNNITRFQNQRRNQVAQSAANQFGNMNASTTFIPSCQQPCDTTGAAHAFVKATSNPFKTQLNANPFTVNAKSFSPSEFVPSSDKAQFPLTMNSTFTPKENSSCPSDESMTTTESSQGEVKIPAEKYKTELCKNWIENKSCRYGKKCQFAHGNEELVHFKELCNADEKLRTKNCRTFYQTKTCAYGGRCMFRHEHRNFGQILRHYYVCKMYTLESLYQYNKDQEDFVNSYETGVQKLSIFERIHAMGSVEEEDETTSESASCIDDSSLSFIEMEEDIIAFCDPEVKSPTPCEEESALNTTIGSSQDSQISDEVAQKLDGDLMTGKKAHCFDIAAQMNLAAEGDVDQSFDSAQAQLF